MQQLETATVITKKLGEQSFTPSYTAPCGKCGAELAVSPSTAETLLEQPPKEIIYLCTDDGKYAFAGVSNEEFASRVLVNEAQVREVNAKRHKEGLPPVTLDMVRAALINGHKVGLI